MVNPPGKEGAYFHYEGYAPHPIGIGLGAGKSPEELKDFLTKATYADARPGGWTRPNERKTMRSTGSRPTSSTPPFASASFGGRIRGCRPIASVSTTTARRICRLRPEAYGRIADDLAL